MEKHRQNSNHIVFLASMCQPTVAYTDNNRHNMRFLSDQGDVNYDALLLDYYNGLAPSQSGLLPSLSKVGWSL